MPHSNKVKRLGRENIPPPSAESLLEVLSQQALDHPTRDAFTLVLPNGITGSLTYREVAQYSNAFAAYLQSRFDIHPGERVALVLPNCLSFPVCLFGVLKCGAIPILMNPLATEREMVSQCTGARVKAMCYFDFESEKCLAAAKKAQVKALISVSLVSLFAPGKSQLLKLVLAASRKAPLFTLSARSIDWAVRLGRRVSKESFRIHRARPDETAAVVFTGGTTGINKGVELTHANCLWNAHQLIEPLRGEGGEMPSNRLGALPCFHAFGLAGTLVFMQLGARNIFVPTPRPVANLKPVLEHYEIHWMEGVPALYKGLLDEPWFNRQNTKSIRVASIGGSAADASLVEGLEVVLGHPPATGYGMSEASPVITANTMNTPVVKDSVGLPLPNTELRIVDEHGHAVEKGEVGEVQVRGPQVMKGYLDNPAETAKVLKHGWLCTGDLGRLNPDGTLTLVDRKKDMIIVGGFKVFPSDVETVLREHSHIADALVFGTARKDLGGDEVVHAAIVGKQGTSGLDEGEIRKFCKSRLSAYKVPRHVHFLPELPKTPFGKPDRIAVKRTCTGGEG